MPGHYVKTSENDIVQGYHKLTSDQAISKAEHSYIERHVVENAELDCTPGVFVGSEFGFIHEAHGEDAQKFWTVRDDLMAIEH